MGKRFKVLEGALKYLATSDDAPNPQAPAGTPLRRFQEYKSRERLISYDRAADSMPEELLKVMINPFGEPFEDANKYIVDLSKRVNDATPINVFKVPAGIIEAVTPEANLVKGFIPAKCTISIPDTGRDDNNATSKFTGVKYNKIGKRSYTFPYGASDASDRESTVRGKILDTVPTETNYGITFTSEKF